MSDPKEAQMDELMIEISRYLALVADLRDAGETPMWRSEAEELGDAAPEFLSMDALVAFSAAVYGSAS